MPIRWRVASAVCLSLLVVMCLAGGFVYLRMDAELDQTINRGLQARVQEITAAQQQIPGRWLHAADSALAPDEYPAQILHTDGRVAASTSHAETALLDPEQLRAARTMPQLIDRPGDTRLDESVRLLTRPVQIGGQPFVVVAGASLDEKRQALSALAVLGGIGLGMALLASGAAGYLVAAVALRPVEAIRRRAEQITAVRHERLPEPATQDEIARLARTLNTMLERIEQARLAEQALVERERRFVADASHELRTPLTVLKSEIEVALLEGRDPAALTAALISAGEETDRLCRLTEGLLALARADNDGIHRQTVRIAPLLHSVVARHQDEANSVGRSIHVACPPDLEGELDPRLVERAVSNLVDNALKHGAGDVQCTANTNDHELQIAVRDQGSGLPVDFREHAFDRFSRAKRDRSGPGSGLGLAIVQAIATAHHGRAETAHTDQGGCLRLVLPRRPVRAAPLD